MRSIFILSIFGIFLFTSPTLAHQPRVVESDEIIVVDPEISKAYYGTLSGEPHVYTISAEESFELYVGVLMPYEVDSKKDVVAEIRMAEDLLVTLGGNDAEWESMFEFFGQSNYWDGGEYKALVDAGEYTITVSSSDNNSKYSLAVGSIESFDGAEIVNALNLIPELKRDFFEESPISFIKSPFGWGYILIMYIAAFIFGFSYRFILKKFAKKSTRKAHKNIGKYDRVIRLTFWLVLLIWAITTTWNPVLLFLSGFSLFEAIFSWCGFYAALGKNTCPL